MFFKNLRIMNSDLKVENEKLRKEVDQLKYFKGEAERLQAVINNKIASAEFFFDFKGMKVFSVERNGDKHLPCTIIGYLLQEPVLSSDGEMVVMKDVVKEWYLYCNEERHQELVNQFKESVK